MTAPSILVALDDPGVLGGVIRRPETFKAWRAFLAALFGLPMSDDEAAIFQRCTGRTALPTVPSSAAWLVIGRRGGKSFVLALIAVFLAVSGDYAPYLAAGERGTIMIVAVDRKQARTIMRYIKGILHQIAALAERIENETAESIDLDNAITIEVATASFRSVRGYTVVAFLGDEAGFWVDAENSANPADEMIAAIRPAMSTIPNAMMLIASSPYARRGVLWDAYRKYFGRDDAPELVWQADTRTMNPTVPERLITTAYEDDPARAAAEYGALFRQDLEPFVSRDVIHACIEQGVRERAPLDDIRYFAFVDPSGGSADAFTVAIAHLEKRILILDAFRERRPPFSPEGVVADFADLLKRYRIALVEGDRYAGEWPREAFGRHGITYRVAERTRSELYLAVLPELNSASVALLDEPKIVSQFVGLERRTSRAGRDTIDHAPGQHDDLANAIAGALLMAKPHLIQEIDIGAPVQVGAGEFGSNPFRNDSGTSFDLGVRHEPHAMHASDADFQPRRWEPNIG